MMNHKQWLWRKRSSEKTIFAMDKVVNPPRIIEEEVHKLPTEKEARLERSSKSLNEKLASVILDCHAKDELSEKLEEKSQEEIRGKDKSKQEVKSLQKDADGESWKKASATERVTTADTALQDSLQKLSFVQEEKEKMMLHDASNISREHEKIQKELEEKLRETSKRLAILSIENTRLSNALVAKEESIGELLKCKRQTDAEFSTLMARLDSTEKENAFLRYEFHMLEKELEIRKEEMEYSRQYAEASHKQYLETIQKVSKLEAECQKLRLLAQKRSPSPTGLVNMKNEPGMVRRRKSNPTRDLICNNNSSIRSSPELSDRSIGLVIKRLQDLDEENKAFKRILTKKNTELESSRILYAETASRLSQAEILLRELSEGDKSMEVAMYYSASGELPLMSKFDIASDDRISSSGSWANALLSELELLRTRNVKNKHNRKAIEVQEMSLLDDFVEMEKRAIISVDIPKRENQSELTGRELVPVEQELGFGERKQEIELKYATTQKSFDWLQIVLNAILEQKRISKRSIDELLVDIHIALDCINRPAVHKFDATQKSRHPRESDSFDVISSEERGNQNCKSNLRKSIYSIIKLIEEISPTSYNSNSCPDDCSEKKQTSKEYFIHVFQWKVSDLNPLLRQLVYTCKDVLNRRADFERFAEEIAFALDWSIKNCATPTNASIARDKIKKHFHCHSLENENQIGIDDPTLKPDVICLSDKKCSCSPIVASPHNKFVLPNKRINQSDPQEEDRQLKDDLSNMESARKDLEARFLSVTEESQNLMTKLQEAQKSIKDLQSELERLKQSKGIIEHQIEEQKVINENLDTQLTIAQSKLHDFFQKFSSLEVELEDKNNSCEELEATCLELQLQLESIRKNEASACSRYEVEKIFHTGLEITKASSKLAEWQETILNLGKQLKALASSSEVALLSSNMANAPHKSLVKRLSLRSQMQAEDDFEGSAQDEENKTKEDVQKPPLLQSDNGNALQDSNIKVGTPETNLASEQNDRSSNATSAKAIVTSKKQGIFGFLRKLLLRKRKGRSKGTKFLAKT